MFALNGIMCGHQKLNGRSVENGDSCPCNRTHVSQLILVYLARCYRSIAVLSIDV
jgi:hypothetical protein